MMVVVCALWSQTITVVNETTLQPVQNAKIVTSAEQSGVLTNAQGQAQVGTISSGQRWMIIHPYYHTKTVSADSVALSGNYTVYLREKSESLDEIIISASKFEEKKKDIAQRVETIRSTDLAHINQSSTADVMANQGNVFVQKSQLGGGSPVIRGFETNKVLMVVDGIRMNNAIYRGGHLQNIITLDNAVMDKVEIVFGPGSVVYGSDALGGVMHFHTRNPLLSTNDRLLVKAEAIARYNSAASGYTGHASVSVGTSKFGSLTSFTYSKFDDLRQGANRNPFYPTFGNRDFYVERINGVDSMILNEDTNLQVGSGYTQYNIMQKFLYKQSDHVRHTLNFQYSTSSDIPRYDRLVQTSGNNPKFAEWYYGPQKCLLGAYHLDLSNKNVVYDHLKIVAAYQQIEESRMDRRFKKDILNHRIEKLNVLSLNIDAEKQIGKQELRYGAEFTFNDVQSTAFAEDIVNDTTGKLDTRYPDGGSTMRSLAVYITHTWEISPKLIMNDGIRFSNVTLDASFEDKSFYPFPYDNVHQNNSAVNGNLGLIYMPVAGWRITATGSTGFRAPNVDDLAKVFESVQGNVIVPNPDLKPEYTYNAELGISKTFAGRVTLSTNGYYTLLKNAIAVLPSTFNGSDSILYGGTMSQVTSAQNASEAYIYGVEGGLKADITSTFSIVSMINYTYGRIKTDSTDYPLDHIPPVFGRTGFNLNIKKFRGEFFVQYSGWKRLKDYNLIGEDNIAYATAEGMPAWYTLNVRLAYQFTKNVYLQVACENILDLNYRQFASNISSPGRNFIITLRGSF